MRRRVLNFISCGNTGDLIHAMYAAKQICIKEKVKANIFISDGSYGNVWGCGHFAFSLEKTLEDVKELVLEQEWVKSFKILPKKFKKDYICLQQWRRQTAKSWTNLLSNEYEFEIPDEYPWISISDYDTEAKGKVLIHRSDKRHNIDFPWDRIIGEIDKEILFITSNEREFNEFGSRNDKVKPYIVETVSEMAKAIKSCDLFVGNQSLPLALATSLDVPRICSLHPSSFMSYSGEHCFSDNISWFLTNNVKHNSENINIKL
jgi:hypothetical protein